MRKLAFAGTAALAVSSTLLALGGQAVAVDPTAGPVVGHVYQPTNAAAGNAIAVFDRHADGSLTGAGSVPTGGLGTGASLASQGAIVRDGRLLFVVNAGDDTISALRVRGSKVVVADRIASGGDRPVSITVHDGVGYVLNHDSDTIVGFTYDGSGDLHRLRGSHRDLTANPAGGLTDAAQVEFSPSGRTLAVTERGSNAIDTFRVQGAYAGQATSHASAGLVPYGFDFDRRGTLVVSEAASGSASSYRVAPGFRSITEALGDTQAAACWLVISGDYAWVVNAASASISSYRIAADGSLTLVEAVAAGTGAGPTDAAVAPDGGSLHVRMRDGSVSSFTIGAGGSLTPAGSAFVATAFGVAGLVAD
ncbi:beta-propeller fold lactonase family protein [Nocardioides agariphilus]|jgi:6-phosphogluconolactonase (cycloisomerase 2 family)|uniref:Beta-propeller fold lactonase family protein n=1 Tax=Nocardioides agariphilus TaxID=433664 RepID=A0A930VLU5_9ACTN|nr:beta-propeller fold lactonase family protein [Nocardioides agariphilus]MBF4769884.1 beta-propeller fold lactonase family protein [Nocardioides agariphilus]